MKRYLAALIAPLVLCMYLAGCGAGADSPSTPTPEAPRLLGTVTANAATTATIHMLGDSTMASYAADRRPQMGWGEAMPQFFDANVAVINRARSGRSSRSFSKEAALWPAILPLINSGDYVIIQFGHNDQKSGSDYAVYGTYAFCSDGTTNGEACTGRADKVDPTVDISEHSYYQVLKKYVSQIRAKGAIPILMSPIVRKYFSGTTISAQGQHTIGIVGGETFARGDYVAAMKAVATKYTVPFIDLTAETKKTVESYGDAVATANLYVAGDSTHPQVLFANLIAKRAVQGMSAQNVLASRMVAVTSLIASPDTLDWSTRNVGVATSKTITLAAFDLAAASGTVTATVPANFAVSLNGSSWSQSVSVAYANSRFISPLYVQFTPTQIKAYSGKATFAVNGVAPATSLTLAGTGVASTSGVASSSVWFTAGTSLAPVSDGPVSASNALIQGLVATTSKVLAVDGQDTTVARYVADSVARNNAQYLQFSVSPSSGTYSVNAMSFYLTTSGGSSVVADIDYSLNADFSSPKKLNATPLTFVKDTFSGKISYTVAAQVPVGGKIYVRVYPWNSAAVTGKSLAVYGIRVAGNVVAN